PRTSMPTVVRPANGSRSGGGKSTLVQLLLGLYSAQRGSIRYGGVPLEEIGLDCGREHVAVVLQHPALFNDSV
ncbi:ATP-binding cassette domain-containing protein, partial [Pseudomonas aeruginosa]